MNPWLLLGAGVVIAGLIGGGYYQGRQDGAQLTETRHLKELETLRADMKKQDKDYREKSALLDSATSGIWKLISYRAPPKGLTQERPTNAPVTSCPDRSDLYWVSYNALAAGAPLPGAAPAVSPAPNDRAVLPTPGMVERRQPRAKGGAGAQLQGTGHSDAP